MPQEVQALGAAERAVQAWSELLGEGLLAREVTPARVFRERLLDVPPGGIAVSMAHEQ